MVAERCYTDGATAMYAPSAGGSCCRWERTKWRNARNTSSSSAITFRRISPDRRGERHPPLPAGKRRRERWRGNSSGISFSPSIGSTITRFSPAIDLRPACLSRQIADARANPAKKRRRHESNHALAALGLPRGYWGKKDRDTIMAHLTSRATGDSCGGTDASQRQNAT